jgi:hypothetical protein
VYVDFVDQWGDSMEDVRLDEGPFQTDDMFISGGYVVRIDNIDNSRGDDDVIIEYSVKDGADWTNYEMDDLADADDACNVSVTSTMDEAYAENMTISSAVDGVVQNWTGEHNASCNNEEWILLKYGEDDEDDYALWINTDFDQTFEMAETVGEDVDTEFKSDIYFSAEDNVITIDGVGDSGGEDQILFKVTQEANVSITSDGTVCQYGDMDNDCEKILQPTDTDEGGTIISLSGAIVEIDATEVEEPENSDTEELIIDSVTVTLPENEVRPTLFFGTATTLNQSSITITDADEGTEINVGGVPVMVEDFGVTGTVGGGGVVGGNATTLQCPDQTASCEATYTTVEVSDLSYSLVVLDKNAGGKNLIIVGGPAVNSVAQQVAQLSEFTEGVQMVKLSGDKLLVAGYEAGDTAAAAESLMAELETLLA